MEYNMKAILQNNKLTYTSNFMLVGKNWVSNPTNEQLISLGFKELRYEEVEVLTVQFEEMETEIICFSEKQPENIEMI